MRIANLHIKGFRNFVDESINLDEKTLIIGGNDTGKSNLLYALRILFDPALSSRDFELTSSDFNIHSNTNEIEITARLEDISEDCVTSALAGSVRDGTALIRYSMIKGGDYQFFTGFSEETLSGYSGRPYIRNLALEYVGSSRDLASFLRRQQNKLLDIARNQRNEEQEAEDRESVEAIQDSLIGLNDQISKLHYVSESLATVNSEMEALSVGNEGYTAQLVAGNTDAGKLLDNLQLAYLYGDSSLVFGGDGRGNQLYFATWISEQRLTKHPEKAVVFAIEEPEAHLHPHQQRMLAEYLSTTMEGQVLITTHSPQIVERFSNGRILRLTGNDEKTGNHAYGCSAVVDAVLSKMGYRLNAISSEVFFSNGVLLVEGPSERILYTALAHALGKDIDRLNISILSVDGVGFEPYVRACVELGIPFAIRTDNDVFGIRSSSPKRLAGVKRLVDIAGKFTQDDSLTQLIVTHTAHLTWEGDDEIPQETLDAAALLKPELEKHGLFLSDEADLEHDLARGPLSEELKDYFAVDSAEDVVKVMQRRKAENMHSFVGSEPHLCSLDGDSIVGPLDHIVNLVKGDKN
ncbi:MAG: AAA family ATPase [Coriobacteriales bacterium]